MSFKDLALVDWRPCSGHWLVLLSKPESEERHGGDLDDLESDTWQITNGMTRSSESRNEHFIVFVAETHTSVSWNVSSDSLVVLFELDSDTLSHGRVGLLGLDGNLFNNNSSSVGGSHEWFLPLGSGVSLFVCFVSPQLKSSVHLELTPGIDSSWFSTSHSRMKYI